MTDQAQGREPGGTESGDAIPGRVKRIVRASGWTWVAFGLLTSGVGGYLEANYLQPVLSVWQIIWLTLPLSVSVAVFSNRIWARRPLGLLGVCGLVIVTFVASLFAGLSSGGRVAEYLFPPVYRFGCLSDGCRTGDLGGGAVEPAARILWAYLQVYGVGNVLRSIVVGTMIGYGAHQLTYRKRADLPDPPTSN
jgi:hypothetical protein